MSDLLVPGNVRFMKPEHAAPPKDERAEYLERVGDISDIEILNTQVLVAVYIRPDKTDGGIYTAPMSQKEDRYQSKVGLVLKAGPTAFVDLEGRWFSGANIEVNDWILFRASDGWALELRRRDAKTNAPINVLCRLIDDISVRAKIANPGRIY
jgi:co-chaperonin GroES (HSP10)